jgi:hypothetical protein
MEVLGLVGSDETQIHKAEILSLLTDANRIVIAVAFARRSGWKHIRQALLKAIKKGPRVEIIVGTDFMQTDPYVLRQLAHMQKSYGVSCFVVKGSRNTFHPKLFYVERNALAQALVGSANLTEGGLSLNAEASVVIRGTQSELRSHMDRTLAHWRSKWKFIEAVDIDIDRYAVDYRRAKQHDRKRPKAATVGRGAASTKLALNFSEHEAKLRKIGSANRRREVEDRRADRKGAQNILNAIASSRFTTQKQFLSLYERLVLRPHHYWHSGQLERGKSQIAKNRHRCRELVQQLMKMSGKSNVSDVELFQQALTLLKRVKGAGPNVLTEILHTLDNHRFAVMNHNSVSGLTSAGIVVYPLRPSKGMVNAQMLVNFHRDMRELRDALKLKDFTELDWLLNRMFHD